MLLSKIFPHNGGHKYNYFLTLMSLGINKIKSFHDIMAQKPAADYHSY